jgi:hypothetical protein
MIVDIPRIYNSTRSSHSQIPRAPPSLSIRRLVPTFPRPTRHKLEPTTRRLPGDQPGNTKTRPPLLLRRAVDAKSHLSIMDGYPRPVGPPQRRLSRQNQSGKSRYPQSPSPGQHYGSIRRSPQHASRRPRPTSPTHNRPNEETPSYTRTLASMHQTNRQD